MKDVMAARKILFALEHAGVQVFPDFRTAWHFDDKVAQKYLLEAIGAPLVPSYVFYDKEQALTWVRATATSAGAHPMDIIDNSRKIQETRDKADYVIVIVHGGHEYYNLPSPRMQKQYRFYADQGADLVVGHHTHCISGHETYNGVPIFYSLGNFLFTKNNPKEDWYTGLVLEVEITDSGLHTQLHPVRQQKETFALDLLTGDEKRDIQKRIERYNDIIADESKLKEAWSQYAEESMDQYLTYWSPLSFLPGRYVKAILRRLGLNGINKKGLALYLNLMRCEAHRDLSQETIKNHLTK